MSRIYLLGKITGIFIIAAMFFSMAPVGQAQSATCQSLIMQGQQGSAAARRQYWLTCDKSLKASVTSVPVSNTFTAGAQDIRLFGMTLKTGGAVNAEISQIRFRIVADDDGVFDNLGWGDTDARRVLSGTARVVTETGAVLGSVALNSSAVRFVGTPGTRESHLRMDVAFTTPFRIASASSAHLFLEVSFNPTLSATNYIGAFIYPASDITARERGTNITIKASDTNGRATAVGTQSSLNVTPRVVHTVNPVPFFAPQLSLRVNPALANQTIISGTSNVKLASFIASCTNENIAFTSFGFRIDQSGILPNMPTAVQNLWLTYETGSQEVQVGNTVSTVMDNVITTITSSLTPVCNAGSQTVFNVYGDVTTNLGTGVISTFIPVLGVVGTGVVSATQVFAPPPPNELALQSHTGSTGGILRVVNASTNPVSDMFVAGTPSNLVAAFQLNASMAEDIFITDITLRNNEDYNDAAITSLSFSTTNPGATETFLGTTSLIADAQNPGYANFTFSAAQRPRVPSNGTLYLVVRAAIPASNSQNFLTGLTPQISLASMKAQGAGSGNSIVPLFVNTGRAVDSTTDTTVVARDTGCRVNATAGITASTTTIDVDRNLIISNQCNQMTVRPGTVIGIDSELMLVTDIAPSPLPPVNINRAGNPLTQLTVVRGYGGTTAAVHVDNSIISYGPILADAAQTVIAVTADDGTWNNEISAGQVIEPNIFGEYMYVVAVYSGYPHMTSNADALLIVDRAVNGTSLGAAPPDFRVHEFPPVQSAVHTIVRTKPTFSAAVDSPFGAVLAVNPYMLLAKMNVAAANNASDPNLNRVALDAIDVRINKVGVNVSGLTMYPAENDLDQNFAVQGMFLSQNSVRFFLNNLTQDKDKVDEGITRTYVIRGNVTGIGANSSVRLEITDVGGGPGAAGYPGNPAGNLGFVPGDRAPDIEWRDLGTASHAYAVYTWTKQPVRQVFLNFSPLISAGAAGTLDTTGPTISSFRFNGTNNNTLATTTRIIITFSEPIDPQSLHPVFVPNNAVSPTPGQGETGDVSLAADGLVTVYNIASTDIDAGTSVPTEYSTYFDLDASTTVLTITLGITSGTGALSGPEMFGDVTASSTTVRDINNNLLRDSAVTATGNI